MENYTGDPFFFDPAENFILVNTRELTAEDKENVELYEGDYL